MRKQISSIASYTCYYFVPTGLAFLGVFFDRWVAWMPALTILVYAICTLVANKGTPVRLMFAGEQIYFIGYLCTIVAFFALAFRLRNGIAPAELRPAILLVGCVALSTTIAGLLGMAILREVARRVEGSEGGDTREVRVTVDLPVEAASSLNELRVAASQTELAIKELGGCLNETSCSASGLGTAFEEGKSGARSFAEEADRGRQALADYASLVKIKSDLEEESCSSLADLQSAYSDAGEAFRTLVQSFDSLGQLCAAAERSGSALKEFGDHLQDTNERAASLGEILAGVESGMRSLFNEISQGRQTLADHNLTVRQKSEQEIESGSRLADLSLAYVATAKTLVELQKVSQALKGTLKNSNSELEKGNAALTAFAKAAPQIKGALEDFVALLERKLRENTGGII